MSSSAAGIFRLNPNIDRDALKRRFAETGRIQIPSFLVDEDAQGLRTQLLGRTDWRCIIKGGAKVFETERTTYDALPADRRRDIEKALHGSATHEFQFCYDVIRVPDRVSERHAVPSRLSAFAQFMNKPDVLDLLSQMTASPGLVFADAQATIYRVGHFLTRHDDNVPGADRRLAYVLSLTADWQAEWGGLLHFTDEANSVSQTIVPRFNALSLFSVPQPHSVSFVAPYAGQDRLSVTGWIRTSAPVE